MLPWETCFIIFLFFKLCAFSLIISCLYTFYSQKKSKPLAETTICHTVASSMQCGMILWGTVPWEEQRSSERPELYLAAALSLPVQTWMPLIWTGLLTLTLTKTMCHVPGLCQGFKKPWALLLIAFWNDGPTIIIRQRQPAWDWEAKGS